MSVILSKAKNLFPQMPARADAKLLWLGSLPHFSLPK
jgi:hypothetical protein